MKINESPALTSVLPSGATIQDRIDLLEEQNDELKQQKICYDGMIRVREKTIKELEKLKKEKNYSIQQSLFRGLLGDDDRFKSKKKRRSRLKSKKKSKRKRR